MIVDHPDCLHVAVDHSGSDEAESSPLQIAAERVGLARRGGNLADGLPSILAGAAVDELPAIRVEAAVFFPHCQKRPGVLHRRSDLRAVPDDPGIGGELVDPRCGVSRNLLWIEVAERATVAIALVEDDRPTESRLRGLKYQELEMRAIVVSRHTPFAIVILAHQHMIDVDPGTPLRLRIRHGCRLHERDKTVHTMWRHADINMPISERERQKQANRSRGVRDRWDELPTGGPMRTLMMMT